MARVRGPLLVLALLPLVTGCGSGEGSAPRSATGEEAGPGQVTVLAATSLADVLTDGERALEQGDRRWRITSSFAGSQQVVAQVQEGAPADVVVLADRATMQALVRDHLVREPVDVATNRLAIAVAPGNPRGIGVLADLGRGDLSVVLADPSVPAGRYAARALEQAGVSVTPRSLELDVRAALAKVISGDADAAIVYVTDVAASDERVEAVAIPDAQNVTARYRAAVVLDARHPAAAAAYLAELRGGELRRRMVAAGFGAPS